MGTRWVPVLPQGSGSLSTSATGSFMEKWPLGFPGTATRAGGTAEALTPGGGRVGAGLTQGVYVCG